MLLHIAGLMYDPKSEWKKIGELSDNTLKRMTIYLIFLGMIPAIGFYVGTTKFGWTILHSDPIKITEASAIPLMVMFYLVLMAGLLFIGWMINWMAETYNANPTIFRGFVFMGLCCSPVFLAGFFAFYPIWWLDLLVGTAACSYAMRLMYLGIPDMMNVPEDQGFLYASAVFAMALVYVVAVLVVTVLLWEYVAMPVFTD